MAQFLTNSKKFFRSDVSFGLVWNENDSVRLRVNAKSVSESFGTQSVWVRNGIIRTEPVMAWNHTRAPDVEKNNFFPVKLNAITNWFFLHWKSFFYKLQFQMYWIFVYKYNGHYSGTIFQSTPTVIEGLKRSLKILCWVQKVKGGFKETLKEWKEDIEDWAEVKNVSLSTMEVRKRTKISTRVAWLRVS